MAYVSPLRGNSNLAQSSEIPDFSDGAVIPRSRTRAMSHNERIGPAAVLLERQRDQEIAEQQAAEMEVQRRQYLQANPTAKDRKRRSGAWWAKMIYTNGYKVFAYEYLTRQIRGHLTPAEQAVFFLIFDRTVYWLKEWETIRISQFVNGSLPRDDGSRLFWGTGLSERAVQGTLKALVGEGLVLRRDTPCGNGLQDYALPRVDLFRTLSRFAGVNISYEGRFFLENGRGGGSWETLRM